MALPGTLPKSIPSNPLPCGLIKTTTAGTAVAAYSNFTNLASIPFKWIQLRGLDGNTGLVYVLSQSGPPPWTLPSGVITSGADVTTYLNVIQILGAAETYGASSDIGSQLSLGQIWIDTSVSGEGCLVTAYQY
jgi:hypothetical protein